MNDLTDKQRARALDLTDEQRARALDLYRKYVQVRNGSPSSVDGRERLSNLSVRAWLAVEAYVLASHKIQEVSETVPERREAPDVAELRRLAENATPGPWEAYGFTVTQHWTRPEPWLTIAGDAVSCGDYCYGGTARGIEELADAAFIAAANPAAVLGLLGDTDALRAELAHMREARDNARTEVERLTGQIEAAKRIGLAHLADVLNDMLRTLSATPGGES